jgi:hypothetical protein
MVIAEENDVEQTAAEGAVLNVLAGDAALDELSDDDLFGLGDEEIDEPENPAETQQPAPASESNTGPTLVLQTVTVPISTIETPMNQTQPPAPPPPAPLPELKLGGGVPIPSKNGGIGGAAPQHSAPASRPNVNNTARESVSSYAPVGRGRRVRVRLQRTHDDALDTKRMREVVKLLRSQEGRDRFALVVPSQKSWVELDFPNFYTNIDTVMPMLMDKVGDWGEVELG